MGILERHGLGEASDQVRTQLWNLKASGALRFEVPDDLKPTDWSGKTDCWIRARLVGGDYGQRKNHGNNNRYQRHRLPTDGRAFRDASVLPLVVKLHFSTASVSLPSHFLAYAG